MNLGHLVVPEKRNAETLPPSLMQCVKGTQEPVGGAPNLSHKISKGVLDNK